MEMQLGTSAILITTDAKGGYVIHHQVKNGKGVYMTRSTDSGFATLGDVAKYMKEAYRIA